MAININQYPNGTVIVAGYNPIEYSLDSTNVAQTNFQFVCDVYPAGATAPTRLKQPANPTNNYCVFDIQSVVKSYLGRDRWGYSDTAWNTCTNSFNNFTVKFGEEYGASSAITVYPNLTTHSSLYAVNGSFDFFDFVNVPYKTNQLLNSTRKFLTSRSSVNVTIDEKYQLYVLNGTSGASQAYNVVCKSYNSAGTLQQTLEFGTDQPYQTKVQRVCVGAYDLNNLTGSETRYSITTAQPFVTSSIAYYDVYICNSSKTQISETKRFYVVNDCNPHTTYKLIFQNKYGGYDGFKFYSSSDKVTNVTRLEMKKRLGAWSGTAYQYNFTDRGRTNYSNLVQKGMHMRSDWLTESESTWLEELLTSTDVLLEDSTNGAYIPVVITSNTYNEKKYSKDGLFNIEIDIEYSVNSISQTW